MNKKRGLLSLFLSVFVLSSTLVGCGNNTKTDEVKKDEVKVELKTISTEDLKNNITKSDWVVVDTRNNDAFNGWKLDGVTRGGHIKGATDFSAHWLNVNDDKKEARLDEALKTKGISSDKNIILYDSNNKDSKEVGTYLNKKGFKNLYSYNVSEWAKDTNLPMESFKNFDYIVPASWIKDLIDGKNPETFKGGDYKIFEVAWGEEKDDKDYVSGHIKGAVHINTNEIESEPLWSINKDSDLLKFAANNGISKDMTVVLYGSDPMASYRIGAILKYLGVKDVRVLNGGFAAWKNAGYELETKSNPKQPIASFGSDAPINKNYIVDINKAKEILNDKANSKLVDIRSWDEYIGKTSGYADLKEKGRPAGSTWAKAGSDPNHLEEYRNLDNTMRNGNEILAMWKSLGIDPNQRLSFFCGSGWRAAEVLIYADVLGLNNISLYSNGWYEWSSNPNNPREVGEPKK